jgi:hypothetical protein
MNRQEKSRVTELDGGIDESYNDRSNREGGGAQPVTFVFQKCLHIQNGDRASSDQKCLHIQNGDRASSDR